MWSPPPPECCCAVSGKLPCSLTRAFRDSSPPLRGSTSTTMRPEVVPVGIPTLASGDCVQHIVIWARSVVASLYPWGVRGCLPADPRSIFPQEQLPPEGECTGRTGKPLSAYRSAADIGSSPFVLGRDLSAIVGLREGSATDWPRL